MIKYLAGFIFLLFSTQINAQSARAIERTRILATAEIYNETDSILDRLSVEVPSEFKDASAVVLSLVTIENITASKNISYHRMLLKINDRAARDKFSIFSFNNEIFTPFNEKSEKIYAISIIKPSGEKLDLEIETLQKNADNEIALPNLEIGDVLDIGLKVIEAKQNYYCYSPKIQTINKNVPIVNGFLRYNVAHRLYINFLGQNGAPQIVRNNPLSSPSNRVYELEYSNLQPLSSEVWAPPARTQKTFKFQVCYFTTLDLTNVPIIIGHFQTIKSSSDDQEKMRAFRHAFYFTPKPDHRIKFFEKWYNENFPNGAELSNEEYMNYAYYHFRYYTLILDPKTKYFKEDYQKQYINRITFAQLMRQAAAYRDIPFEPVFSTSKGISAFDDGLLISEFSIIIRYQNELGEWKYMENPTSYQTTGYFNHNLQGQDALALNQNDSIERIVIPISNPNDNLYRVNFVVEPSLESKSASIDAVSTTTGLFKYDFSRNALKGVEFHEDAMKAMLPEGQSDVMMQDRKTQRGMLNSKDKIEQSEEDKLLEMKTLLSENLDVEEYTLFEIINSGVVSDSDSLIYKENYTIKDVVEKAGPSYVINLSKIAFNQISFTDKEKAERINDIYINYPKTYEYLYHIHIPEGYKAYGLDAFKESVDSKYGSVEMHAYELDNQVVVYLKKVYKESFIPKEEWGAMMEFLGPAMKLNDARIVLKKQE